VRIGKQERGKRNHLWIMGRVIRDDREREAERESELGERKKEIVIEGAKRKEREGKER
jgi:hypothetical protein